MGESSRFEVNVPVDVARQQWQRFRTLYDTTGVGEPEFREEGAGRASYAFRDERDLGRQESVAREFARFAESDLDPSMPPETSEPTDSLGGILTRAPGESGMPLVGKLGSPGAPGSGMNDSAGVDQYPRKRP